MDTGGAAVTVSESVVVLVKLPDTPATVTLTVPVAALPLAVNVKVLVLAVLVGLNEAVTPLGRPEGPLPKYWHRKFYEHRNQCRSTPYPHVSQIRISG